MNASPGQQRLRISSPAGMLAVVPHLLGFTPSPAWSCSASRPRPAGSSSTDGRSSRLGSKAPGSGLYSRSVSPMSVAMCSHYPRRPK
jgi:hypothetical protein